MTGEPVRRGTTFSSAPTPTADSPYQPRGPISLSLCASPLPSPSFCFSHASRIKTALAFALASFKLAPQSSAVPAPSLQPQHPLHLSSNAMSTEQEELGYLSAARYGKDLVRVCRVVRHPSTEEGKPGKQEGASWPSLERRLSSLSLIDGILPFQSSSTSSSLSSRATSPRATRLQTTRESFRPTLVCPSISCSLRPSSVTDHCHPPPQSRTPSTSTPRRVPTF